MKKHDQHLDAPGRACGRDSGRRAGAGQARDRHGRNAPSHLRDGRRAGARRGLRRQETQQGNPRRDAGRVHAGRRGAGARRVSRGLRRVLRRAGADAAPEHDLEPADDARSGRRRDAGRHHRPAQASAGHHRSDDPRLARARVETARDPGRGFPGPAAHRGERRARPRRHAGAHAAVRERRGRRGDTGQRRRRGRRRPRPPSRTCRTPIAPTPKP